jgi:ribosome-associated protein
MVKSLRNAMNDPLSLGRHGAIPLHEIQLRASRSSGPGGQHANVTASRIEASFEVATSQALTDDQKKRIIARLGPRVVAVAQDSRSQSRNRELALERLQKRLTGALAVARPRRATKPTRASTQRRLESKRRQAERKRARRPPGGDDG